MIEKTFGEKEKGRQYTDRAGVYAVILDNEGSVAAVRVPEGNFLIGGGIEEGETHRECLKRECLEETGYDIEVKDFVCKGNTYFYAKQQNTYHYLICYFYLAELREKLKEPTEADHEFEWLAINEIEETMFFEHHIWAIKQAMRV